LLADGADPGVANHLEKTAQADTFQAIALEWLPRQPFAPKTREKALWTFQVLLFPYLGHIPVSKITAP
jgi:hypothetical protein